MCVCVSIHHAHAHLTNHRTGAVDARRSARTLYLSEGGRLSLSLFVSPHHVVILFLPSISSTLCFSNDTCSFSDRVQGTLQEARGDEGASGRGVLEEIFILCCGAPPVHQRAVLRGQVGNTPQELCLPKVFASISDLKLHKENVTKKKITWKHFILSFIS